MTSQKPRNRGCNRPFCDGHHIIGGTLTSRGGNLIVIDDPLKPQDAYSEAARENTKQWYSNKPSR
jgi:hypothetical protein